MIEREYRDLTTNERRRLRERNVGHWISNFEGALFGLAGFTLLLLLPVLILPYFITMTSKIELFAVIIVVTLSLSLTVISVARMNKEVRNDNVKPLQYVRAEILHINSSRALKREDPEDLGVAFYLDVQEFNNRKTLYLWGQYLDMLEYEKKIPNTSFMIIRRDDTKEILDLKTYGEYFEPERTLPAFDDEVWNSGDYPADGEILSIEIDDVV